MNAGISPVRQLRRGIARGTAQLYVRRRTTRKGTNRVLVSLPADMRYAICVWASYRPTLQTTAFAAELHVLIREGIRVRLGDRAEEIIEAAYEDYVRQCKEDGVDNIFETVTR